ncbi:MAG: group III truncated hemoglobin [Burkholderiales bacterium]|nr:group III truncated hemoglobin [Burkholderiales bacterium]
MPTLDLCTEEEVANLVYSFYDKVREDALLGPFFNAHVKNWDSHLLKMVDFWSSALRGTARFRGTPMPTHAALPGVSASMFQHWLQLFRETTATLGNSPMQARANLLAQRIAESLWYGYQLHRQPVQIPQGIDCE